MKKRTHTLAVFLIIISVLLVACGKTDTIICDNCSVSNSSDNQYCSNCGATLFQNETTSTTEPSQSDPFSEDTVPPTEENSPTTDTSNTQPTQPEKTAQPTQPKQTTSTHTHSYSAATCTQPGTCSCGATNGEALGHSYTSKITEPTCLAKGYVTYICSFCGNTYKDNYKDMAHNYHNYVCTSCGIVDKTHAFEYITIWIYQNGNDNGNDISVDYTSGGKYHFSLSWNPTYNLTSISLAFDANGETFVSLIDLKNYEYCTILEDTVAEGKIDPTTFTKNSSITATEYRGDHTSKNSFLEVAQISIRDLLDWFDWFLAESDIGITIADLGFIAY